MALAVSLAACSTLASAAVIHVAVDSSTFGGPPATLPLTHSGVGGTTWTAAITKTAIVCARERRQCGVCNWRRWKFTNAEKFFNHMRNTGFT